MSRTPQPPPPALIPYPILMPNLLPFCARSACRWAVCMLACITCSRPWARAGAAGRCLQQRVNLCRQLEARLDKVRPT
jgi:hypothetical protein